MTNEWTRGTFTIDNVSHDHTNILAALDNFLTHASVGWVEASWSPGGTDRYYLKDDRASYERWQYNGDGPTQYSGLRIWYDSDPNTTTGTSLFTGEEHIVIQSFLENSGATASQVMTPDYVGATGSSYRFGTIRLRYDDTAPNNYLVIGGEDGLYVEVGRDASENNLGHGAIMTFGAIPELHHTQDAAVQWTSQGLVCDFYDGGTGGCRFTTSRNRRWVQNNASEKNFTAALQPYSARGTRNIITPAIYDQNPYYIGSRDSFYGASRSGRTATTFSTISTEDIELDIHATFGLCNTPLGDRYRISPMMMLQSIIEVPCGANSSSGGDVSATNLSGWLDPRAWRQLYRFAAVDYTLLPFQNVQDAVSGAIYRVARMEDNGRYSQFGIEWPSGEITIPVT